MGLSLYFPLDYHFQHTGGAGEGPGTCGYGYCCFEAKHDPGVCFCHLLTNYSTSLKGLGLLGDPFSHL